MAAHAWSFSHMPTMPGMFRPAGWRSPAERNSDADRRRGSASERGYDHRWSKASKGHLRREPVCRGCQAVGRVTAATLTDHIVPHRGDTALFWQKANWQSCCDWHHVVIKQLLELMYWRGEIGVDDLRLDSAVAVRLTRERDPGSV
jgi:5-methylcytosine-specific restriction enzyme A